MTNNNPGAALGANPLPGPWIAKSYDGYTEIFSADEIFDHVAIVYNTSKVPWSPAKAATARLIAESPNMLAALQKALAYLNQDDDCDDVAEVRDAIEDAIDRATGVAS